MNHIKPPRRKNYLIADSGSVNIERWLQCSANDFLNPQ